MSVGEAEGRLARYVSTIRAVFAPNRGSSLARRPATSRLNALVSRRCHVRQRQSDDFDIRATRLLYCLGSPRDGGRRDRHDQLHAGVDLEHRLRFGKGAVTVSITRLNRNQCQLRILRGEPRSDVLDPLVLIRRAQTRSDDDEVTRASHARSFQHSRRRHTVHTHERGESDRELAYEVIRRRLAGVVCE